MERLFRTYPSQAKGANEFEIARNRMAAAEVYMRAVAPFTADDVEEAVNQFLTGGVPGFNAAFAPTAPQVGSVCRRVMERRLDTENRMRRMRPRLPPPDIEHTPEERERAKAKVQAFIEGVAAADLHVTTEERKRQQERWEKVNAHFDPPQDEESLTERLHLRRGVDYTVGAPESDDAAA
jgi:hypothetical protein